MGFGEGKRRMSSRDFYFPVPSQKNPFGKEKGVLEAMRCKENPQKVACAALKITF